MASLSPLVFATGLGLEVFALRNPTNVPLKIAATIASAGYLAFFILYNPPGTFTNVWPLGMNIYCCAQRCWNYLWLRDAQKFRRIEQQQQNGDQSEQKRQGEKKSVPERTCEKNHGAKKSSTACHSFKDAMDIALTFRGVGWSFEAKGLPKLPAAFHSRRSFICSQLEGALFQFLILDFAITLANSSYTSVESVPLPIKFVLGAIMLLYVRWTMDIPYRILSVITVITGICKPSDWPPLYGEWKDSFTIRRFWSHTWHQGMRLLAEAPSEYVAHDWLQLPKGSYESKWCRVFGNFFVACLDHAYGRIIAGGNAKNDWIFFALQPAAIWVEETARIAAVKYGWLGAERSWAEKWAGFLWTAVFECWTFLYFMEGAIRIEGSVPADTLIEPALGLSLFKFMVK